MELRIGDLEEFPAACNICEKVLDNEDSLKRHKKNEHTFHIVRYQCDECNFMANDITTLHVHFGMHHSVKKQCGLCDKEFKSAKELDVHQSHCEICQCSSGQCKDTFEKVEDIKEHIKEEHKKISSSLSILLFYNEH